jgi:serine/threonine protein phosphatase PrpC/type II secretory pathway pseudopilin PulG
MAYEISFTRLTNSVRLTDRYLTVQVQKSTDPEKSSMGTIFALIEITNPWSFNSQIGQNIINTLIQEYYKQNDKDALSNFENALKKVNLNLSRITQEGETNWIGNLNAILAVVADDEIHLTQAGKAESFLFRDGHINPIATSTVSKEDNPIKTFIDITSGKLNSNDKILLASSAMLDYLSKKELQDIITINNPYESSKAIAQFFKKENARHINSILIEATSKAERENTTLENQKDVVYLDQVNNLSMLSAKSKDYTKKMAPIFATSKKSMVDAWKKLRAYFEKEISPRVKDGWKKTKEASKKSYDHLSTKTAPELKKRIAPVSDKIKADLKKHSQTIIDKLQKKEEIEAEEPKKPYSVHYYEEKPSASSGLSLFRTKLFFSKAQRKLRDAWKWALNKENRSILYVIIVIVLVVVLSLSIIELKKKQQSKNIEQEQSQILDSANNKFEEAKLAILYNEMDKAKGLLNDVITNATQIMKDYPSLKDKAEEIINKANVEFDKLTYTTRFTNPTLVANFSEANKIFNTNGSTIALNNTDSSIYYVKDGDKIVSTLTGSSNLGSAFSASGFDNAGAIYALTKANQLYKINSTSSAPEKVTPSSGVWENAIDISYFLDNLYLLDSTNGQIYKHAGSTDGFDAGTNYVDGSKIDIKGAVSFTVDGFVYVLKSDGSVIKMSLGIQQDFNLQNIPEPSSKITKAKKIWTNSEINSLYVLDDNRVIEFNKDGKFTRQYAFSPEINNISDFFINHKDKKMWILNDKNVYQVEL